MEKIIQIHYQNRNISIEENAYEQFKAYELSLQQFFAHEESGDEIFMDLQMRMAEIFESKLKNGKAAIDQTDILELISIIGKPADFGEMSAHNIYSDYDSKEKNQVVEKKLYRLKNRNNRVIAGVCSGIANYTNLDPIVIRLIFILFSFNIGIIVYLILWVVLPVQELQVNLSQKLFRNPKDKILGGICSGLAHLFNVEPWIVRIICLIPLAINILSHQTILFHVNFFGRSLVSFTVITYIILWIITPIAKSSTDFMLMKGEPINLNTIQQAHQQSQIVSKPSGFNIFFKIIAYLFLGLFLLFLIPSSFGLFIGSLVSYQIVSAILFSPFYKFIAMVALFGFIALPILGFTTWIIRKIAGYKSPNKPLRIVFATLGLAGLASMFLLVIYALSNMNTIARRNEKIQINTLADTIYVESMHENKMSQSSIFFNWNKFDELIQRNGNVYQIKGVSFTQKPSKDSSTYLQIEYGAFGPNQQKAFLHTELISYRPNIINNTIQIPTVFNFPASWPYRLQHIRVVLFVPAHKTIIVSKQLKNELNFSFYAGKKGIYIHGNDDDDWDDVIRYNTTNLPQTIINDEGVIIHQSSVDEDEKIQQLKDAQDDLKEVIRENEDRLREAKRNLEDAQKSSEQQLQDARNNLEKMQQENERALQQAEQKLKQSTH